MYGDRLATHRIVIWHYTWYLLQSLGPCIFLAPQNYQELCVLADLLLGCNIVGKHCVSGEFEQHILLIIFHFDSVKRHPTQALIHHHITCLLKSLCPWIFSMLQERHKVGILADSTLYCQVACMHGVNAVHGEQLILFIIDQVDSVEQQLTQNFSVFAMKWNKKILILYKSISQGCVQHILSLKNAQVLEIYCLTCLHEGSAWTRKQVVKALKVERSTFWGVLTLKIRKQKHAKSLFRILIKNFDQSIRCFKMLKSSSMGMNSEAISKIGRHNT